MYYLNTRYCVYNKARHGDVRHTGRPYDIEVKKRILLSLVALVFTLIPVGCVYLSEAIASVVGCSVSEATVESCDFLGIDIGRLIYMFFVSGWLGIITFPVGGITTIVLFLMALSSWNDTEII